VRSDTGFEQRLAALEPDLRDTVSRVYGADAASEVTRSLVAVARAAHAARPAELRALDERRLREPDWFQRSSMVGYAAYADRFAGTLRGVGERGAYLRELGVGYLHLMPLLTPRPAPNDGGYAVMDYRSVRPDLGTVDDLRDLATTLRGEGISLCLDLVLNHVAREHEWALAARAGDPDRRAFFHVHPDREVPDAYEATLPEVFPDFAPGSFTWDDELSGWVWTTFNDYQWDLDWSNPAVLREFADIILSLANLGVEVFRLDAIAFIWKRLGTDCQNQPEVHDLTRALRTVARIAAPAVLFKAEAIVGPADLPAYLGVGEQAGRVSDLAYHNGLMVQVWSMLASRDARLATYALQQLPQPPSTTAWITYVRCHDDIGWAITPEDASRVGEDAYLHRRFLADWFAGDFPGSFSRGARFQPDPATGEARTSGTCASLAGLDSAPGVVAVELAFRRVLLLYAIAFAHGGLPLIYMGDELGLLNDASYLAEPDKADDNRWMHRPLMDWDAAELRHNSATVPGRLFAGLQRLVAARRATRAIHVQGEVEPIWTGNDHVFGLCRAQAGERLLVIGNFTAEPQPVALDALRGFPLTDAAGDVDGRPVERHADVVVLAPYQHLWLADE